ncbi:unnamed protein product [Microthlaspi erraticum]|nr:unnamed protein product [Microthlaspi erraticum]
MSSPQAPPPSWDSPPKLSSLKTKKKLLPYLEAADLETSSQAASYREEHLLATPEEEINPEMIEFVKRDQFHHLFSEYALEHLDHFDNLCDSYGVFDFEKKMMLFSTSLAGPALDWAQHEPLSTIESWIDFREAFLKRFARLPPFKSKYNHYSHQLEREREEEEWGGIPPHLEELIKHVERNPFYNSTSECAKEHLCNFEQLCHDYGVGDNPKKIQLFQLSLAGQAKEWAKFNAQHAFKTWNGYKGAFLYRFAKGPIYVPPPRPSNFSMDFRRFSTAQKRSPKERRLSKADLSRIDAQTAQNGRPRNACSALGQNCVRPSEVSAKVQNRSADHASRPGKLRPAVGHATTVHASPRTTMPREPGNKASRPRNLSRVPRPMVPARPKSGRETIDHSINRPTTPADR